MAKLSILLVILLAAVAVAQNDLAYEDAKARFSFYAVDADQDNYRRNVFNANAARIRAHNANPKSTHTEAVNEFTFMTQGEFSASYLGTKKPNDAGAQFVSTPVVGWNIVTSVDWTTVANVVTPVKNQGGCGSCWAFSAVAAIESLRFQGYGVPGANFAEQQLVDCSGSYGNNGCKGGWMTYAFKYVIAKGIANESAYPYTAAKGACKKRISGSLFKISSYTQILSANCNDVAAALAFRPLSVALCADGWQSYSSGVFSVCGTLINHGVLLVGVTSTTWLIKNSWGTGWGQQGFMYLDATNGANTCRICDYASYPM